MFRIIRFSTIIFITCSRLGKQTCPESEHANQNQKPKRISMIAKTPNIRCFVAKTRLSRFTRLFRQQMSFYPFGVEGSLSAFFVPFFLHEGLIRTLVLQMRCIWELETFCLRSFSGFDVNKCRCLCSALQVGFVMQDLRWVKNATL